jgi:hypothetical protein
MNIDELERKLIMAARSNPPSDRVPYAFEMRIMERLKQPVFADHWSVWGQALWRAAAPCVAIMVLFTAWTVLSPTASPAEGDIDQELERTVMASFEAEPSAEMNW